MEERTCSRCNQPKIYPDEFAPKYHGDKRYAYCRDCYRKQRRGHLESQSSQARRRMRQVRYRAKQAGIPFSEELYWALIDKQDQGCAICGGHTQRALSVDHCHKTGKIRGLLCGPCNSGLGFFQDDISRFEKAIAYLREHNQ